MSGFLWADVNAFRAAWAGAMGLVAVAAIGCRRAPEPAAGQVGDDMKGVARATEKTAQDIGRAAVEATQNAGAHTDDAWITTKVKGELTREGFDPLHVHVDTDGKVVTLSGSVPSKAAEQRAVSLAHAVTGVAGVTNHLFIDPAGH